jgi:hypothetical protein
MPFPLLLLVVLAPGTAAWADSCIDDAIQTALECRTGCKDAYLLARDTCSNRDHLCVESCRSERSICREPFEDTLGAAIAACNATLAIERDMCRSHHPDGSAALDSCIDGVQVAAFLCRDGAREQVAADLRACSIAFKTCVRTNCPPASEPDPAARKACKDDAKALFKMCAADCQEAKQLARDTCLDRDHACVEDCRAMRESCRAPYVGQRDNDVAACNLTRETAIDDCRNTTGAGTPERDACIDQAQVTAFQCRDTARENVADALRSCRLAFQECAEACPPPGATTTTTTDTTTTTTETTTTETTTTTTDSTTTTSDSTTTTT